MCHEARHTYGGGGGAASDVLLTISLAPTKEQALRYPTLHPPATFLQLQAARTQIIDPQFLLTTPCSAPLPRTHHTSRALRSHFHTPAAAVGLLLPAVLLAVGDMFPLSHTSLTLPSHFPHISTTPAAAVRVLLTAVLPAGEDPAQRREPGRGAARRPHRELAVPDCDACGRAVQGAVPHRGAGGGAGRRLPQPHRRRLPRVHVSSPGRGGGEGGRGKAGH